MHSTPLLSIIIPTKNRLALLQETLQSVLEQSAPRWEAIVVDDGSDDGTWPYLQAVAREDERVRPMRRRGDVAGACAARNQGAAASNGPLLMFLDSDDVLEPFAVEDRLAATASQPVDLLITQGRCFAATPGDMDTLWNGPTAETPGDDLDRCLRRDVPWQTTGATWTREAFARSGGWDEHAPSGQDMDLHVRALLAGLSTRRTQSYDFHWRIGTATRSSIGTASVTPSHIVYRCVLLERFARLLRERGMMNDDRREILGGQWWLAVKMLREREPRHYRHATKWWDRARRLDLIGRRQWLLGTAWLVGFGRRQVREPIARLIERSWSPTLRGETPSTLTTYPVPTAWAGYATRRREQVRQESGTKRRAVRPST